MINYNYQVNQKSINHQPYTSMENNRYLVQKNHMQSPVSSSDSFTLSNKINKSILPYSVQSVSFGYDFKLKEQEGLPCPCCGITMITVEEKIKFADDMENATGKELIAGLRRYQHRLPESETSVVEILIDLAEENKDLELDELLRLKYPESLRILEHKQRIIMKDVADLAENLTGETKEIINKDLIEIDKIIVKGKNGDTFKRKILVNNMSSRYGTETNPENKVILMEIFDKVQEIPSSGSDVNAFFVKYNNRKSTSREIAERLLYPSIVSTEHIKPHDDKGSNGPENYLAMCNRCNGNREKISYKKWIEDIHPEMIVNVQIYIDEIIDRIIKGKLEKFDYYPEAIKKALNRESEGIIILDISRMEEYLLNKQPGTSDKSSSESGLKLSINV